MKTVLIEVVSNGYIVKEDYARPNQACNGSYQSVKVFNIIDQLNDYLKTNLVVEDGKI
jgi:hypothetical protein